MSVVVYVDYDPDTREVKRESILIARIGKEIASKLGRELSCVVVNCRGVSERVRDMKLFRRVYSVKIEGLGEGVYNPVEFARAVAEFCRKITVEVLLFPTTARAREIAPYVAAILNTGIVADVSKLYVDEKGEVIAVKPSFGENILAHIAIPDRKPKIFTVRASPELPDYAEPHSEVVELTVSKQSDEPKLIRAVRIEDPDADILPEKSDIVIGVGAGLHPETVKLLKEIARRLRLGLAATKKVTDRGVLSSKFLVGDSGKIIRPRLYIALGISGAPQHMTGVKESNIIVAVNVDEKSPIAQQCDFFIKADANELVRLLAQRVLGMSS